MDKNENIEKFKIDLRENRKLFKCELPHLFVCIIVITFMITFFGLAPIAAVFRYTKSPHLGGLILSSWYIILYIFLFDKEIYELKLIKYISKHLGFYKEYSVKQSSLKKEFRYLIAYDKLEPEERIRYWTKRG
jgi:hypothetical protein